MAFDYDSAARNILNAFKDDGKPATLTHTPSTGSYDPVTGKTVAGAEVVQTVYILTPPASGGTVQAFDTREDGVTVEGLRFVIMAAHGLTKAPEIGDTLAFDGSNWRISGITPVRPADVVLTYRVGVRDVG